MDKLGKLSACDFQQVECQPQTPVPVSRSLCKHLENPFPDTDRCSVPPISTSSSRESPLTQGPIAIPPGGPSTGPSLSAGTIYTFVLPTTMLTDGAFIVTTGSGSAFGADQRQVVEPVLDDWIPIDSIWGILVATTFTTATELTVGTQNAGSSGSQLDIACSFGVPSDGELVSITLKLQNLLASAEGLIALDIYEGGIAGGPHPAGGPAPLPFLGSTNAIDAATIPDAVTDVTFTF